MTEAYRTYCKMEDKSNVELSVSPKSMIVQVGIFEKYVCSINFPADVNCFLIMGHLIWGMLLCARKMEFGKIL